MSGAEGTSGANAPKSANDGVYHLQLKQGDVPGYVILPGAPERTSLIAKNWTNVREVASYREFKTVTGDYKDVKLAATSTGIGGPSSEICIHELNRFGRPHLHKSGNIEMETSAQYVGTDPQLIEGDVFRMVISVPEFAEQLQYRTNPRAACKNTV